MVQTDGKTENLFFSNAQKYCDELCTSKAGVSFGLFGLQYASDKAIWLLVFLAWCLLFTPYARPQSVPI